MKCEHCGNEYSSIFHSSCPYCGHTNSTSLLGAIFGPGEKKEKRQKSPFDPYDWDNPDNCSDREYMDDDDYDDFDS